MNKKHPTIKNIIFDLGEVLLPLDFKRMHDALTALGVEDAKNKLGEEKISRLFRQFEIGQVAAADIAAHVRALSPRAPDDGAIFTAINAMLLDFPAERIAHLHSIKGKYRLFLFSNTNALHHDHFHRIYERQFGGSLNNHFEKAYYSHHLGQRKPDVSAFMHVIKDAGVIPAETLFIDDVLENTQGAAKAGLQTVYLTSGKTILDLGL